MKFRVWFITGASRGFGLEIAKAVLEQGGAVVAAARNPDECRERLKSLGDVLAVRCDVTDRASVALAVDEAARHYGKIDVLVNNAGFGLLGAMEELDSRELEDVFKTNVFGVHTVTRAILPILREQHSGYIVNISSAGGFTASPGWGAYNSSKFALEGMSESLAQELAPLGIKVLIVEPGPFRTDWAGRSLKKSSRQIAEYAETAGASLERMISRNGQQAGDPVRAGKAIIEALESDNAPLHLVLGMIALETARTKIERLREELDDWEEISLSADFPESHAAVAD